MNDAERKVIREQYHAPALSDRAVPSHVLDYIERLEQGIADLENLKNAYGAATYDNAACLAKIASTIAAEHIESEPGTPHDTEKEARYVACLWTISQDIADLFESTKGFQS